MGGWLSGEEVKYQALDLEIKGKICTFYEAGVQIEAHPRIGNGTLEYSAITNLQPPPNNRPKEPLSGRCAVGAWFRLVGTAV